MLKQRVRSGILMGAALLAALYFLPPAGAVAVLTVLCGLGMWEYFELLRAGGIPHQKWPGMIGGMVLIVATWICHSLVPGSKVSLEVEALVLFATLAFVIVRQMFIPPVDQAMRSVASTMFGVLYIAWLFNFLNKLLLVFGFEEGRWLIFYLALVVKLTDVGAFFIGSRLGGPKFFPAISPAKTWSGVLGGLATGMAFSYVGLHLMQSKMVHLPFNWVDALALGFLLSVAGILGDLIESMLKRSSGVKDSGQIIQGMGGFLDVVDSLIFAAPVLYIYMRLFVDIIG